MSATITLLQRDHVNFARLLNVLERQIDVAHATGAPSVELVKLILLYFREFPGKVHHPKENMIYNALLLHRPQDAHEVFDVIANHRDLSQRMEGVERAVDALDPEHVGSVKIFCHLLRKFVADERAHMDQEEAQLYPSAARLLTPAEWAGIDYFMGNEADPLFGDAVAGPYAKLAQSIFEIDGALELAQQEWGGALRGAAVAVIR